MTRVLFTYDGSVPARRGLEYARRLQPGDEVAVISVAKTLIEAPHTAEFTDPEQDTGKVKRELAEAAELLAAEGVTADPILAIGNPAAEIIRVAEERRIELIVVGSHGQHALERFLVGSIAERLVRHAPCDVLVVR